MISGISSGLSALGAFARKQQSIADNTANVNTDRFKKTRVDLKEGAAGQVEATVRRLDTPGPLAYEQTGDGYEMVEKSNVELTEEIPRMLVNRRSYQANVKTIQAADEMLGTLLDIKS